MAKQVGKRILQMILVLFGISFLTFCLMNLAPGDPVSAMYASQGTAPDQAVVQETREALGLDKPLLVRYGTWLSGVLRGDLGTSLTLKKPVAQILGARLWPTVKLALFSLLLVVLFSFPLGMLTAVRKNRAPDVIIRVLAFIGNSMPGFFVALLLMYLFGLQWKLLPVMSSGTSWKDMLLPAVTLAVSMTAVYIRQIRTILLGELRKGYVRGGQLRGLPRARILWAHVLRNSLAPVITLLGVSFGSLLGGTAVVEVIFSYPGLGSLAVQAVSNRDYPLIQGYVLWTAVIYMAVTLAVDIICRALDPEGRDREQREGGGYRQADTAQGQET